MCTAMCAAPVVMATHHAQVVHEAGAVLPDLWRSAAQRLHADLLAAVEFAHGAHHHVHRVEHQRRRELVEEEGDVGGSRRWWRKEAVVEEGGDGGVRRWWSRKEILVEEGAAGGMRRWWWWCRQEMAAGG